MVTNNSCLASFWTGCGHCKKLAPVLSEAAIKMKEVDQDIVFAKVCVEIYSLRRMLHKALNGLGSTLAHTRI